MHTLEMLCTCTYRQSFNDVREPKRERERLKEIHIENRERRQKLQQRTIKKNSLQFALVQANAFLKPEILILIWNEKFRLNTYLHMQRALRFGG